MIPVSVLFVQGPLQGLGLVGTETWDSAEVRKLTEHKACRDEMAVG